MLDILDAAIDQKYNNENSSFDLTSSSFPIKKQRRTIHGINDNNFKRIKLLRFDGTMTQIQRTNVIQSFQENSFTQILLVSLKYVFSIHSFCELNFLIIFF